jgi:hypothetical protein
MIRKELYWYCPEVVRSASGMTSKASLLSSIRIDDLDESDLNFPAFLVGVGGVEPIQCRVAVISEYASGTDESGMPATLFNGEVNQVGVKEAAISTSQNQVVLKIEGGSPTHGRPALISTEEDVSYSCSLVTVDLLCSTVAEVPDFTAGLEHLRTFEERLREGWYERPPVTYSDELAAQAKETRLGPGHILPVTYHDGDRERIGVLVLNHEMSDSPLRFSARLYLFHKPTRLEQGAILSRRVLWNDGSHLEERLLQVARIVSVLETS